MDTAYMLNDHIISGQGEMTGDVDSITRFINKSILSVKRADIAMSQCSI